MSALSTYKDLLIIDQFGIGPTKGQGVLVKGANTIITDNELLASAITKAGINGVIRLYPGSTFLLDRQLSMLAGQTVIAHGATLKRANQAETTTTTAITANVTTQITVASTTGFLVGQKISILNGTSYDTSNRLISSIVGSVITVSTAFGITASGTTSVYVSFASVEAGERLRWYGGNFDGNRANTPFARWENTQEFHVIGGNTLVSEVIFTDIPGEGIEESTAVSFVINSTTNPFAAAATSLTLNSSSGLSIGNYVILSGPTGQSEPMAHRVENIVGNVITIDAPGAWFASSSGNVTVYKLNRGNVFSKLYMDKVGGNGIHLSGSLGTQCNENQIYNANLNTADVGHRDGGIIWSNLCIGTKCQSNHIENCIAGFGSLDSIDNSGTIIVGNTIVNCDTYAVEINYAGVDGYGPRDITVTGNNIVNSGPVSINLTGATTDPLLFLQGMKVSGNNITRTVARADAGIIMQRARDFQCDNNILNFRKTDNTVSGNDGISIATLTNGSINNNTMYGGYRGLTSGSTNYNDVSIDGNKMHGQRLYGVYLPPSGTHNNVTCNDNDISSDSSCDPSNYQGIVACPSLKISGGSIYAFDGYACIRLNAGATNVVIQGVKCRKETGATYTIRVEATVTGAVVIDNQVNVAVSDAGTATVLRNNDTIA